MTEIFLAHLFLVPWMLTGLLCARPYTVSREVMIVCQLMVVPTIKDDSCVGDRLLAQRSV